MSTLRSVRGKRGWRCRSSAALVSCRAILLLSVVAGCDECVAAVEISPGEVHAASGAKMQLTAIGRDESGVIIDPQPATDWKGAPIEDPIGNRATVVASGPSPLLIRATMGGTSSPHAKILVNGGNGTPVDHLDVGHRPGTPPALVLLDAKAAGDANCNAANDRKLALAGIAALPMNLVGGCDNEIVVFDHSRAPLIESLDATAWTDDGETVRRVPSDQLSLNVKVWYFVVDTDPTITGALDLKTSQVIFDENRVGMRHDPVEHLIMPVGKAYDGNAQCTGIEDRLGFTANQNSFHVVYVTRINWLSDPLGWACPDDAARGDVVLISWTRWLPTIVGHEIVHRMGFATPPFDLVSSGHVTGLDEFDQTNLMWSPIDPMDYGDRFYLTLGQVYRMHAANESWLNRAKIRDAGSTTKACPKEIGAGICPRLSLGPQTP